MAAWSRYGGWRSKVTNNSYLELQAWSREIELGLGWGPKLPKHVPKGILRRAGPYLLSTHKGTYWSKNIQILKKNDDFSYSIHFLVVDCTEVWCFINKMMWCFCVKSFWKWCKIIYGRFVIISDFLFIWGQENTKCFFSHNSKHDS